jgi:tetratricopeptide (TPR) repeat protein
MAAAYGNRGNARGRQGDLQGAIADYDQVARLTPNDPAPYFMRGLARLDLRDARGALDDLNQALRLLDAPGATPGGRAIAPDAAPDYRVLGHLGRAGARFLLGDDPGAIEDYTRVLQLDPNHAEAYALRGSVRALCGDQDGARDDLRRASELFAARGDTTGLQGTQEAFRLLERVVLAGC